MKSRIGPILTESPIGRMIIALFSDPKGKGYCYRETGQGD
jgi:hypothetical protein